MFKGPESDRLALRELVDRYSDAVMRLDADAWIATWADNAEWTFRGGTVQGRDVILKTWKKAMSDFTGVLFMSQLGAIEVEGDNARMITHTFEHLVAADGTVRLQAGLYNDEAIREDGWRFVRRSFSARELKL
jgi:ketosteroid isomerase-like protein